MVSRRMLMLMPVAVLVLVLVVIGTPPFVLVLVVVARVTVLIMPVGGLVAVGVGGGLVGPCSHDALLLERHIHLHRHSQ
jgi:hypothetical protein